MSSILILLIIILLYEMSMKKAIKKKEIDVSLVIFNSKEILIGVNQ